MPTNPASSLSSAHKLSTSSSVGGKPTNQDTVTKAHDASPTSPMPPGSFVEKPKLFYTVSGAIGAAVAITATAPLDVLRTRLQSHNYTLDLAKKRAAAGVNSFSSLPYSRQALIHLSETLNALRDLPKNEGPRALFKGLAPNLLAAVPARGVYFYVYGNTKQRLADKFFAGEQNAICYAGSAALGSATAYFLGNPLWVIKTRLQLDRTYAWAGGRFDYKNAVDCLKQIAKREGLKGLYSGLGASMIGISEAAIHWTLYEQFKQRIQAQRAHVDDLERPKTILDGFFDNLVASGVCKGIATLLTYPHEVIRTRLRMAPFAGQRRYNGIIECFKLTLRREGLIGLYGGLTVQLIRVIPNSAIMVAVYEAMLRLFRPSPEL